MNGVRARCTFFVSIATCSYLLQKGRDTYLYCSESVILVPGIRNYFSLKHVVHIDEPGGVNNDLITYLVYGA